MYMRANNVPEVSFQSAPGPQAGGNCVLPIESSRASKFQSAPGPQAGGNGCIKPRLLLARSFNPPPARRPGETFSDRSRTRGRCLVSIRPRPAGRGKRAVRLSPPNSSWFQSAPGPQAGGNHAVREEEAWQEGFNPPPARRPGETTTGTALFPERRKFQSAPGPQAGGNAAAKSLNR